MEKRLTVEIDEELHNEAKSKAYSEGKTLKDKIIELLRDWLRKK
jgi:predicted HicB family RNase H-like nuclease